MTSTGGAHATVLGPAQVEVDTSAGGSVRTAAHRRPPIRPDIRSLKWPLSAAASLHVDTMVHASIIVHVTQTIPAPASDAGELMDQIIADYKRTIWAMKCAMSERAQSASA